MKILFVLAGRNVWRNKRRSLIVITSISVGTCTLLILMSFINGMNKQMVENAIRTSLGHISIRKDLYENMELSEIFSPSNEVIDIIKDRSDIKYYARRLKLEGMISTAEGSQPMVITGIEPNKERNVSNIYNYTVKRGGSGFLTSIDDDNSILISKRLAERLEVGPGDKSVIMLQNKYSEIVGVGLKVKGIYQTPIDSFDKYTVFVNIKKLQEIMGLENEVSEITIIVKDQRRIESVKENLIADIKDNSLEVLSWQEIVPHLVRAIKIFDSIMYTCFIIVFISIIFFMTNILVMSIMERFREIGIMKAIGTRPKWIFSLVMIESAFLSLIGLTTGTLTGLMIIKILSITGIDFSVYAESLKVWGTGAIIYPVNKPLDIIMIIITVLMTAIIAAIYPAIKASRIKILEAMHYV